MLYIPYIPLLCLDFFFNCFSFSLFLFYFSFLFLIHFYFFFLDINFSATNGYATFLAAANFPEYIVTYVTTIFSASHTLFRNKDPSIPLSTSPLGRPLKSKILGYLRIYICETVQENSVYSYTMQLHSSPRLYVSHTCNANAVPQRVIAYSPLPKSDF